MLQIVETRILSVISFYHLAFFAISMAMFGMTAGSLVVYFNPTFFAPERLFANAVWITAAFAVVVVLSTTMLISTVVIDPATGFFRLLKYFVAHDCGRPLNRAIVEGQVVGGVAEGIGGAILSNVIYAQDGQPLTGSLADYLVTTAPEVPSVRLVHRDTRSTTNPLGVRGIGEGGLIPVAAAITNALARAIDAERSGHEQALFELPLAPERVLAACKFQHAEAG